jgi:protocatechuate 3,4-dioxygenase beta subunit
MSDNDDIQIGRILSRREVLVLLGAAGTAATIAACAPGATASPSGSAASGTSTGASAGSSGAVASATAVATSSELAGAPSCVVVPALTEGPYYVDEKLQRSDITANADGSNARPGAALTLAFAVSTVAASGCTPLADALVDVWHCDAVGSYSDISASGNGGNTTGQNWLRGYQLTDASGKATFRTVYPGWYQGRTVHIHFKIRTDAGASGGTEFTSQLFFDDAINDAVLATTPYSTKGTRSTRNDNDSIFGQSNGMLTLALAGDATAGFTTTFEVGLQA